MRLAACALAITLAAMAEDWPEFRGPTGQGLSTSTGVPVEWSSTKNVQWKATIPGRGWSSPAVANGRIYLTTAESDDQNVSLRALSIDAATGKIVWNKEIFRQSASASRPMHQKNSLASPTPIVRDGRIYAHFGHLGTAALDLQGNVVWRQTELSYSPVHGNGGSPALARDVLVFSADGATDPFVVALSIKDGQVRWRTPRKTPASRTFSFSTPLIIGASGAEQVISPGSAMVAAYNLANGQEIWRVRYDEGYSVTPRPVFAHGLLFVSSSFDRPVLYAIRSQPASGDVTDKNIAWTLNRGAPHTPSPLVVGDELYLVSDNGIATCVDARTGKAHWTERLRGGGVSASPVYADGKIYFQNEDGMGFVVKSGTKFEMLSRNDIGARTLASPAIADGALFIRTETELYRIGSSAAKAKP